MKNISDAIENLYSVFETDVPSDIAGCPVVVFTKYLKSNIQYLASIQKHLV